VPWSPDTAYLEGLGFFSAAVVLLDTSDWRGAPPCSGWTALDVLGHVGTAVRFGTELLGGGQPVWAPADPPGADVAGDPRSWWDALVTPARRAVADVDLNLVVESPVGRRTVGDGLSFPAVDLHVHAWDLARSVGRDIEVPAEATEFAHAVIGPIPTEQMRSPRIFGPAVAPPPGATRSEAFIAWTGRDPRWASPAEEGH
jgi:uncharacterized protein (TIGR03086 family)